MAPPKRSSSRSSTKAAAKQARLTDSFRQTKRSLSQSASDLKKKETVDAEPGFKEKTWLQAQNLPEPAAAEPKTKTGTNEETEDTEPDEDENLNLQPAPPPETYESLNYKDSRYDAFLAKSLEADISKPIHQEGLSTVEKILKHFDLSDIYGPTVGMTRLQRWKRAEKLGLNPPPEVLSILVTKEGRDRTELREGYLYGQL